MAFTDSADGAIDPDAQSIQIYKKKDIAGCQFILFQKIPFHDVKDMVLFAHGPAGQESIYLATVNQSSLTVMRQSGSAGFTSQWQLRVTGGQAVQPVFMKEGRQFVHMIVGQGRRCRGSLVFEAKVRGASLMPVSFQDSWNFYN